jgi:hypothetical protein
MTTGEVRTRLRALFIMIGKECRNLTINGVVIIADAIKFIQTNKEKLSMIKEKIMVESKELNPDILYFPRSSWFF